MTAIRWRVTRNLRIVFYGLGVETDPFTRTRRATPAMDDDTMLPFPLPAVGRKKVVAAFDGGRLTSDGGAMLLGLAERHLNLAERLAGGIADHRDPSRVLHPLADILRARMLAIAC